MVHGWMRRVSKRLVSRRRKKGPGEASISHSTVHGYYTADFMLRQDARRFMLGKYLSSVTNLSKKSFMSTLWRQEFLRICSKEDLTEKAQDIEVTIPVKKSQEARYNLFFVNYFWGRRPDGVAINEALKIGYILEFKRSTDRDEGFLDVKDAEANEQHKNIIGALKAAAPECEFEQINFVVGNRGSVVESDFYTKLEKLDVQEGGKDKLFADHLTQVCEALNRWIVSFLQQVQGGQRPATEGLRENISPDHQNPQPSIYIDKCTVYTYMVYMYIVL